MTMKDSKQFSSKLPINYIVGAACFVIVVILTEILLAYYLYRTLEQNIHEKCINEVRKGICKEEFRQILEDPEISTHYQRFLNSKIQNEIPKVEFFKPGLLSDLDNVAETDSWTWPTGYSRIPVKAIEGFCKATNHYCPEYVTSKRKRRQLYYNRMVQVGGRRVDRSSSGVGGFSGGTRSSRGEERGEQGLPGPPGPPGPIGLSGVPGIQGPPGLQGPIGPQGHDGPPGNIGAQGPPGENGPPGPIGAKGDRGDLGIPGQQGQKGDTGLPGPPGLQGTSGSAGPSGSQGHPGPQGPIGPVGGQGHSGYPGMQGAKGDRGDTGAVGVKGDTGLPGQNGQKGYPGLSGQPGVKGEQGLPGLDGIVGPPGEKGESGFPGLPGEQGVPGLDGLPGINGEDGLPGPPGPEGLVGFPGVEGPPGTPGEQGLPGLDGVPGLNGVDGLTGPPGPQGPPGVCQFCADKLNKSSVPVSKWEIRQYGTQEYSGYPPRKTEYVLEHIEIPVDYGFSKDFKSWMVDSEPPNKDDAEQFWATTEDNYTLFEYKNKASFLLNTPTRSYDLYLPFEGNTHVINKGSFFYKAAQNKPRIIKYVLNSQTSQALSIPNLNAHNLKSLYSTGSNYFDFSVDDNGLWVIFAVPDTNNTGVMKVDPDTMSAQYIWNITLDHHKFNEMFVASGFLYTIDKSMKNELKVSFAVDLYTNKLFHIDLNGIEQLEGIAMATYDYRLKQLLLLHNGYRVGYPVVCGENDSLGKEVFPE